MGTLAPYTDPLLWRTMGLPMGVRASRPLLPLYNKVRQFLNSSEQIMSCYVIVHLLCDKTPIVSSKVMALILSDARIASLSARVGSSLLGTLADSMTHISQRLTLTALKSARLSGDP